MVRLVTLGTTDLRDAAGNPVGSVLRQPRRFALLVYLALESRRGTVRRDRVLGTFWPEVSQDQGRRALSQALHYLRRSLGPAAIVSRGAEDLLVSRDQVACDACDLLDRLEAGDGAAALRLYAGDLLPGFYGGVPDFDDWLDLTRQAMRRAASDAAWAEAERARRSGEWVAAGSSARRAAGLTGGDEAAVRRLMSLLADVGDRAGALQAYEGLAAQLEREYDAAPAEATAALAAEIRARDLSPALPADQRLAERPAVEEAAVVPTAAAPTEVVHAAITEPRGWRAAIARYGRTARSAVVTGALTLGFISLWGLTRGGGEPMPAPAGARLLVEEASGAEDVARSLTGEVVRSLAGADGIEVLLASATPPPRGDAIFLLRTALLRDGDSLQATVALSDRATGAALGADRIAAAGSGTQAVDQLAGRIAAFARRSAGVELERRRAELGSVAPAARTAWLRAHRDLADADSLHDAGLLDAARVRLEKADSLLSLAQRSSNRWVEVPLQRAELELVRMWVRLGSEGDWTGARAALAEGIRHADRALALSRGDARALEIRGVLRTMLWLSTPPDSTRPADHLLDAAHSDLESATRLATEAARAWQFLSVILFTRGEYAGAYYAADRALSADAYLKGASGVRTQLFWSALEVGDTVAANRTCEVIRQESVGGWHGSYCSLVLAAWSDSAPAPIAGAVDSLVDAALRTPYAASTSGALDAVHAVLLAKSGDEAAARTLLARVLTAADTQPELLHQAAWVHVSLREPDEARTLLDRYIAGWPAARAGILKSRRFVQAID